MQNSTIGWPLFTSVAVIIFFFIYTNAIDVSVQCIFAKWFALQTILFSVIFVQNKKVSIFCGDETIYKMLTLNFSKKEIQQQKYEKDFNPCVRLRKRSHAAYLKMSPEAISRILCIHRNGVGNRIKRYQSGGISALLSAYYYCPKSELERLTRLHLPKLTVAIMV